MTVESRPDRAGTANSANEVLDATSFLFGTNAAFIEALYAQYLENPNSVDGTWRAFFDALGDKGLTPGQLGRGPAWRRDAKLALDKSELTAALTGDWGEPAKPANKTAPAQGPGASANAQTSIRAIQLVRA